MDIWYGFIISENGEDDIHPNTKDIIDKFLEHDYTKRLGTGKSGL